MLTLLTDFGLQDVYVGVMKGVIAGINPHLGVVDLTHQIPPQDIVAARFNLLNAVDYFPAGTVHLAVVDPGVGGKRRAIAVAFAGGYLVGPDNGLFSGVLGRSPTIAAVELTCSTYWRTPDPSPTFHGRDLFAAAAAHLASGVPLADLGTAIDPATLVQLPIPPCVLTAPGSWLGTIQYIDSFGNLVSNLSSTLISGQSWHLILKDIPIGSAQTYGDRSPGQPLALIGSHGWIEIAVNQGSARLQFGCQVGDRLELKTDDGPLQSHWDSTS
ncbi:hypothetical protein BST81_17750 [Leptolyngbya sp. 'hensonii']|uniref:SAM hydrolase/SAM-dependent halogenase family protein n=1 Tax=Leptolyngbya sp. 'hensonii' TaxID=1922337 RepID=UPI00094F7579|nr:SAM-dependent chlorinase/fluorinase [Leptolyngbya sp. 'hensonii']OLP17193.1 hypothetical protein BST81_17750 [Leptolyngbya sp. 'hensonii']